MYAESTVAALDSRQAGRFSVLDPQTKSTARLFAKMVALSSKLSLQK